MDSKSSAAGARKIAPVYLINDGEMLLDAPVAVAWRHVIDYPSWQNYSVVEHISGEPGQEGQVVMLKKEEEGAGFVPYYARTIKLEPQRRIIWKTYPVERAEGNDYFGIVEFTVHAEGSKTRFRFSTLYETQVPHTHEAELEEFLRQQRAGSESVLAVVLPKLRQLVEAHPEAHA